MNDTTMWWVLAGALVALELATGTFYLLMLAVGMAAAALAAHAGAGTAVQLVCAAVGGVRAVLGAAVRPARSQGDDGAGADRGGGVSAQSWRVDAGSGGRWVRCDLAGAAGGVFGQHRV